jgi:pilus assembly protein Flp/PilA
MHLVMRILADRSAATAAEYALLLAIVGATLAVGALALGNVIAASLDTQSGVIATCGGMC